MVAGLQLASVLAAPITPPPHPHQMFPFLKMLRTRTRETDLPAPSKHFCPALLCRGAAINKAQAGDSWAHVSTIATLSSGVCLWLAV